MRMKTMEISGLAKSVFKNRYVLLVLAAGLLLILWPTASAKGNDTQEAAVSEEPFSLEEEEKRLRTLLQQIAGAGDVQVLLSVRGGVQRHLAQDGDETLVVSSGSGKEQPVELSYSYPEYTGAVVVCGGADDAGVKLNITGAVAAYTGLGADKITVIKMKS